MTRADAVSTSDPVEPARPANIEAEPQPSPDTEPQRTSIQSLLSAVGTFGPPVTIVTALLVYFGWARSQRQAQAMGLDVSQFGYSTQDYVLRSISTLYIPLVLSAAIALACLTLHRRVAD